LASINLYGNLNKGRGGDERRGNQYFNEQIINSIVGGTKI
jgi:hypothetical protein